MERASRLQELLVRLYNDTHRLEDLGLESLAVHLESISLEVEAEIQIEINKGAEVTFK